MVSAKSNPWMEGAQSGEDIAGGLVQIAIHPPAGVGGVGIALGLAGVAVDGSSGTTGAIVGDTTSERQPTASARRRKGP